MQQDEPKDEYRVINFDLYLPTHHYLAKVRDMLAANGWETQETPGDGGITSLFPKTIDQQHANNIDVFLEIANLIGGHAIFELRRAEKRHGPQWIHLDYILQRRCETAPHTWTIDEIPFDQWTPIR